MGKKYKTQSGSRIPGFEREQIPVKFTEEEETFLGDIMFADLMQAYSDLAEYEHGSSILMPEEGSPLYDMTALDYINYLLENNQLVAYETGPIGSALKSQSISGVTEYFDPFKEINFKDYYDMEPDSADAAITRLLEDIKGPDTLFIAQDFSEEHKEAWKETIGDLPQLVDIFLHELGHTQALADEGATYGDINLYEDEGMMKIGRHLVHNATEEFNMQIKDMTEEDWENFFQYQTENVRKWHKEIGRWW